MQEMFRVLKPGGKLFLQLPFIIGYHPCPNDYWRFTNQGLRCLVEESEFNFLSLKQTVGPATGFYRISVEFFSILCTIPVPFLYRLFKGFFALIFFPIKYLDLVMNFSKQSFRIAGGYYVICDKPVQNSKEFKTLSRG